MTKLKPIPVNRGGFAQAQIVDKSYTSITRPCPTFCSQRQVGGFKEELSSEFISRKKKTITTVYKRRDLKNPVSSESNSRSTFANVHANNTKVIEEDVFAPKTFYSTRTARHQRNPSGDKVIIDLNAETVTFPKITDSANNCYTQNEIFLPNFIGDVERKQDNWINKSFLYRQNTFPTVTRNIATVTHSNSIDPTQLTSYATDNKNTITLTDNGNTVPPHNLIHHDSHHKHLQRNPLEHNKLSYLWLRLITDDAECELNCKPIGMKYFATLNNTVIDGTMCFRPAEYYRYNYQEGAVCVNGISAAMRIDVVVSFDLKSIRDVFNMSPERANLSIGSTWYVGLSNCHLGVLEELRKLYRRPHFLAVDAELSNINYVFFRYEQGAYMHLFRENWNEKILNNIFTLCNAMQSEVSIGHTLKRRN
ncbi:hypothetical protein GQX74_006088 [Glossina fuscipes]|nr:hypothetical protein GQX74_006088 [Glossina fuscipes]